MSDYHNKSLELDRSGEWEEAHRNIQAYSDALACEIHGYLHRVEGDLGNAAYWYGRAGKKLPSNTLEAEWARLHQLSQAK